MILEKIHVHKQENRLSFYAYQISKALKNNSHTGMKFANSFLTGDYTEWYNPYSHILSLFMRAKKWKYLKSNRQARMEIITQTLGKVLHNHSKL